MRDADPLAREPEQLDDLAGRELRVDDDQVARPGCVGVLARVHAVGLRVHPVREAEREEVVDRRRADASALWRVHPVGEVEDVERPRQPLDGTVAEPAPAGPPPVRLRRKEDEPPLHRHAVERLLDPALARRRDGGEGDDLVLRARFRQAAEHPEDVVPDPGPGQGERRDVDDDAQRATRRPEAATTSGGEP